MKMLIKEDLKAEIFALIKSNRKEVVLLLDGEKKQDVAEVHALVPVKNTARSDFAFIVEEDDFLQAKEKIGYNIVGLFHSHKSSTRLSESDISQLKNTNYPWLIGSINEGKPALSCYCLNNGKIKGIEVL